MDLPNNIIIDLGVHGHERQVFVLDGPQARNVPVTLYPKPCPFCEYRGAIHNTTSGRVIDWLRDGKPVQDVFPQLTPDRREEFISGVCKDCWDKGDSVDPDDDLEELLTPQEDDEEYLPDGAEDGY